VDEITGITVGDRTLPLDEITLAEARFLLKNGALACSLRTDRGAYPRAPSSREPRANKRGE
jgi:hypothetical protein